MVSAEKQKRMLDLEKIMNKKFGNGTIASAVNHKGIQIERLQTGILSFDIALGGGFAKNTMNIVFGRSSAGKSTLILHSIANLQKQGYTCAYIYTESIWDSTHLETCGVNLKELKVVVENNTERCADIVETLATSKAIDYIVIDSLQGLVSQKILGRSATENTVGGDPYANSLLIKKFIAATSTTAEMSPWCTLTLICHGTDPFGGGPLKAKGGDVKDFFAVQSVEVRAAGGLNVDGAEAADLSKRVGYELHFKLRKNKTFPPYKTGYVNYYIGSTSFGCNRGDIDIYYDISAAGVKYGIFTQGGAWIHHNENKWCGKQAFSNYLRSLPQDELQKLKQEILKKGLEVESNIVVQDLEFEQQTEGREISIEHPSVDEKPSKKEKPEKREQ